jgi:DNA-binding NarL/FixJ family response regulator
MTGQLRVLIADPCAERRTRLGRALGSHPSAFAVSEAAGAADCLAQLIGAPWEALVLGDRLPDAAAREGVAGLAFLDRLREAGIDLPVLLLVPLGDPALAAEASRHGATDIAFQSDHLELEIADRVSRAIALHRQRALAECACRHPQQLAPFLQRARALWHNVNNPLFAIEGTLQLLLASGRDGDPVSRGHLDRIQRACEQIHAEIGQFREATLPLLQALETESTPLEFPDHLPSVSYEA